MDLSVNVRTRPRFFARPLSTHRIGDLGLFLIWMTLAVSQMTRVFDDARYGDLLLACHRAVIATATCVNAVLFLLRGRAVARSVGFQSRLIAFLGTWMIAPLAMLPLTWNPDWLLVTITVALTVVYGFAIWALLTLRRSFSVFPEARHLVRHGPYALVRHPLYAVYIAAYVLVAVPRVGPAAVVLVVLGIVGEVLRARNEEQVLGSAFPNYADYAAVTPRFWPRLGGLRRFEG